MICIFFINGSGFNPNIPYNRDWIQELKKKYIVKHARYANMSILQKECKEFIDKCIEKYKDHIIGILGISSGGYFALRLKKLFYKLNFCIGIAPVLNPSYRKDLLEKLPNSKKTPTIQQLIQNTPCVRKIYNTIDNQTLIIIGKKDIQVPVELFDDYNIPHLIIVNKKDHYSIQKDIIKTIKTFHTFLINTIQ